MLTLGRSSAALIAVLLTAGAVAVPTSLAATADAGGKCLGSVVPGSMKIDIPDVDLKGRQQAEPTYMDDEFLNVDYASHGDLEISIKVPDGAKKGDQFWIDMDDIRAYGYSFIRPTAPDGTVIATTTQTHTPSAGPGTDRLILTWTDYVETHKNVTASFRNYVYAHSTAYPDGFPRQRTPGKITACDGTSLDVSVRSDGIYNEAFTSGAWADDKPSNITIQSWTTPSQSDANLLSVTYTVPDYLSFSGAAPNVAVSTWSEHYAGSADDDTVRDWRGLVTAQKKAVLVSGTPTKPGQYQTTFSPDKHTMTVTAMVNSNEGLYVRDFRWAASSSQAWRETKGVPFTVTEQGTSSVAKAVYKFTLKPTIGSAGGDGNLLLKAVPAAPTLQTDPRCGTRPGVVTPKTEGVEYKTTISKDGSTASITATAKPGYSIPSDVKKQWTLTIPAAQPCPAVVSYNPGGGQGIMGDTSSTVGGSVPAPKPAFTRPGYTFTGWALTAGGKPVYQAGDTITLKDASTTLYATWKAQPARLVYDANGGAGQASATEGVTDAKVTVSANPFTRPGYAFAGWNTAADGSGEAVSPGSTRTLTPGTTTLYAAWSADPASLVYDGVGASGTTPATTGATDSTVTVAESAFTRPGYAFACWNTAADGSGESVAPGSQLTLAPGTTTLYATWKAEPAFITYDPAGGTGEMEPTVGVTDGSVTVAESAYTRPGYSFAGWNTAADGSGESVAPGSQLTLAPGTTTLYATWMVEPAPAKSEAKPVASLARTGAAFGGLLATAGALMASGAVLLRRRRS